jgi:hypothetical protein
MRDLLNAGQVLGRSEMKKIMAGSGNTYCTDSCTKDSDCDGGSHNTCNKCCNIPGMGKGCATSCG